MENKITEGKVIVKDMLTGKPREGVLTKDERFWGGYKVEYENTIVSIKAAEIVMEAQVIKGVGTLHIPTYKIHGLQRRRLKQQYSLLRSFAKSFSWHNQVDLDMGGGIEKEKEKEILNKAQVDLNRIKTKLEELYDGNTVSICEEGQHWYPTGMRNLLPGECMFCLQINNDIK